MSLTVQTRRAEARWLTQFISGLAIAGMLSACATSAGGSGGTTGTPFRFALIATFSGANGYQGYANYLPVKIACGTINQAGGVLGHKCAVDTVNDYGDSADAVPALRKEIAGASGLTAGIGLNSTTAPALIPILLSSHLMAISFAGESQYVRYPQHQDLYMLQPPDEAYGLAMAVLAKNSHYTHPAVVTTDTTDAVPTRQGILSGLSSLGIKPAINLVIAPTQTSYGTEVASLATARPDAIIFELDPVTAATFFRNLSTREGGHVSTPLISDTYGTQATFVSSVSAAIGKSTLVRLLRGVTPVASGAASNPSLALLSREYTAGKPKIPFDSGFDGPLFDATILAALAATEAHSVNPAAFGPYLAKIATPRPGAVTVQTYAQGVRELKAGKQIYFLGASGGLAWNSYHSRLGDYSEYRLSGAGTVILTGQVLSTAAIAKALKL